MHVAVSKINDDDDDSKFRRKTDNDELMYEIEVTPQNNRFTSYQAHLFENRHVLHRLSFITSARILALIHVLNVHYLVFVDTSTVRRDGSK